MNGILIAILLCIFAFVEDGRSQDLWGGLQPGPYSAGFQVIEKYDYSRTYRPKFDYEGNLKSGERARPVQISVWFPAAKQSSSTPILFQEYVHLTAKEDRPGQSLDSAKVDSIQKFVQAHWEKKPSTEEVNKLLDAKTAAIKNTPADKNLHPVIIFAHSTNISSPYSQSILCEYLATHGYIVASSPAFGDRQKQLDRKDPLTQLKDIEFLIAELRNFPAVDRNKFGIIGFGFGALTAVVLAMNNYDVDAVVSLDGSFVTKHGYSLLFQHPLYKPARSVIPILHVAGQEQNDQTDLSFFNAAKYSSIYQLKFRGLESFDYTSLGMISTRFPGFGEPSKTDTAERQKAYEGMSKYVLNFLNAFVAKDGKSIEYLNRKPEENGLVSGLAVMETRLGLKKPPSEEEFVVILQEKGIAKAKEIFQEVTKNDPDYRVFRPDTLNSVAKKMSSSGKTGEAIEVLKINHEAYPDDWRVLDALGTAYAAKGERALAIDYFGKSLDVNPENEAAAEMIKKLKESQ